MSFLNDFKIEIKGIESAIKDIKDHGITKPDVLQGLMVNCSLRIIELEKYLKQYEICLSELMAMYAIQNGKGIRNKLNPNTTRSPIQFTVK